MSRKNFFIAALQIVVLGAFIMIAASSGEGLSRQEAYDAGCEIGHGISTIINN